MNGEPDFNLKTNLFKNAAENFYASSTLLILPIKRPESHDGLGILNTNGTLAPAIETSPEQILSILNTIFSYDQWTDRFDKSKH